MTKTECRKRMTQELLRCVATHLDDVPLDIKLNLKGTKNYLLFTGYELYLCFYVTSDLRLTMRTYGAQEKDVLKIEYGKNRSKQELNELTRNTFKDALKTLREQSECI